MITVEKPPKYSSCISCGAKENLYEYLFSIRDDGIKQCITICNNCVAKMYEKSKETKDDKGTENN